MWKQLLFSALAGLILFVFLFWINGPISNAVVLAALASGIVQTLQLGTAARNLLTGIKLDLVQIQKTKLEMEKLVSGINADAVQIEKARGEMAKINEELRILSARVYEVTPDEVIRYGRGEALRPSLLHEGKETKL